MQSGWSITNNGFSGGKLTPQDGEFLFLEKVCEMTLCANIGYLFSDLEDWQQKAIKSVSQYNIRSLDIKYDHKGGCVLSGTAKDLKFAIPLLQHALNEYGVEQPLVFQCVDNDKIMTISIGVQECKIQKKPIQEVYDTVDDGLCPS